jgi:flagellar biosynthesis protein FlhG
VPDQAEQLRERMQQSRRRARVIAVTSGKGGVGKTSISVNLSIALAARGLNTVVLDADLGLANVEVLLGLNSLHNLQQVVQGERRMSEILVDGPGGIHIVPGSSGMARIADLGPRARQNILNGMEDLQQQADVVVVDTMAGIGQNAVAFSAAADEVVLVTTPEPSAIVDGYAMIKTIFQLRQDAVIRVVVNQAVGEPQARAVAAKLDQVAQRYLSCRLSYLGYVPRDTHVSHAVMQSQPFLLRYPTAPASRGIEDLAQGLLSGKSSRSPVSFLRRVVQNLGLAKTG